MILNLIKGKISSNCYSLTSYEFTGVTYDNTGQTYSCDGLFIRASQLNNVISTSLNDAYIITSSSNLNNAKTILDQHFYRLISNLHNTHETGFIITEDDVIF